MPLVKLLHVFHFQKGLFEQWLLEWHNKNVKYKKHSVYDFGVATTTLKYINILFFLI